MVYLDDILIYTQRTKEKHEKEIQKVLQLLQEQKIQFNPEKSEFTKMEVMFLGIVISWEGLKIEPEKTKAIRDYPILKTIKEV